MMKAKAARIPRPRTGRRSVAGKAGDLPVRGANVIDRYSLALQLVQVGQPVVAIAAVMVGRGWPARILAGLALVGGSLVVLHRERINERHAAGGPTMRQAVEANESAPLRLRSAHVDDEVNAGPERKVAEEHALHLSIELRRKSTRPHTRGTPKAPWPIHHCSEAARSLWIHRRTAEELDELDE